MIKLLIILKNLIFLFKYCFIFYFILFIFQITWRTRRRGIWQNLYAWARSSWYPLIQFETFLLHWCKSLWNLNQFIELVHNVVPDAYAHKHTWCCTWCLCTHTHTWCCTWCIILFSFRLKSINFLEWKQEWIQQKDEGAFSLLNEGRSFLIAQGDCTRVTPSCLFSS